MESHAAFEAGVKRAVAELVAAGKRVWLIGSIPEIGYDVPRALYLDSIGITQVDVRPTREEFDRRQSFVFKLFTATFKTYGMGLVWPHEYLCDLFFCQVQHNGSPLYVDDQHLTRSAALSMWTLLEPIFSDRAPHTGSIINVPQP